MKNLIAAKTVNPTGHVAKYHEELIKKHVHAAPEDIRSAAGDPLPLAGFNGYYALDCAAGAFFAIDTNLVMAGNGLAVYVIDLLVSTDGTHAVKHLFTGSFDGSRLLQNGDSLAIDLTFTRTDGSDGTTVTCAGTIMTGKITKLVKGATYNNPIPPTLFTGQYYDPGSAVLNSSPLLQINNYALAYNGDGSGLQPVMYYVYNFNMYYFTAYTSNGILVRFIMGSAAEGGLACNVIQADGTAKQLQTVPYPDDTLLVSPNSNSAQLAAFSGYYQLPSIAPLAFISIEGQYYSNPGSAPVYRVKIGVSMDGIKASGYYFEQADMTFFNNTLNMPAQQISITFSRVYNAANQSLVTLTGSIAGHQITAYTLFNPVPLSAFGGVAMKSPNGSAQQHTLSVENDTEVIYDGIVLNSIIYVPVMYILASPTDSPTIEMSFGTSGVHGNACIVTEGKSIGYVLAIPSA